MTCYEHLRNNKKDDDYFKRLQSYFHALENDKVKEYHKKRGRK